MSDEFDRAIERVLDDRSPLDEVERLGDQERAMLRMAQMLHGSRSDAPRHEFVEELHGRLFSHGRRISRRAAFLGGLGTLAAGLIAGLGLDRLANRPSTAAPQASATAGIGLPNELVGSDGHWAVVARVEEVPRGAVRPFAAGSVRGYLINEGGSLRAMSRICTHMGCVLNFDGSAQELVCPCHGAQFTLQGTLDTGTYYPLSLPPLPAIKVRTREGHIEVWTI